MLTEMLFVKKFSSVPSCALQDVVVLQLMVELGAVCQTATGVTKNEDAAVVEITSSGKIITVFQVALILDVQGIHTYIHQWDATVHWKNLTVYM